MRHTVLPLRTFAAVFAFTLIAACAETPNDQYAVVATARDGSTHVVDRGLTQAECRFDLRTKYTDYVALCEREADV